MRKFLRLASGVLGFGVLALGVVAFHFACPRTDPPPKDPDLRSSMTEEGARKEQLGQLEEAIRRRREAKWQVAEEVIARRCSLAEAIEQFHALDRQWPELGIWITKPEDVLLSPDEWAARDVLHFVQLILIDRPNEAAAVADRLEKELHELLSDQKKRRPEPADPRTEPLMPKKEECRS
jgi:hypothetical protein